MRSKSNYYFIFMVAVFAFILPVITMFVPQHEVQAMTINQTSRVLTKENDKDSTTEATTKDSSSGLGVNELEISMDKNGKLNTSFDKKKDEKTLWNWIYEKGRLTVTGISGFLAIVCLGILIFCIFKFVASSIDAQSANRGRAIVGIIIAAIGIALFGTATAIFGLFWNYLK